MPTVEGIVDGKFKNDSGWWNIKVAGRRLDTKKTALVSKIEKGMRIRAEVTESVNGDYTNYLLDSWEPVGSGDGGSNGGQESKPETDWDAKDRAIAYESALSSAAQFMQALAVAKPEAVTSENWINAAQAAYQRIQKARAGGLFD